MFYVVWGFLGIASNLRRRAGLERDDGQPCIKELGFDHRSAKESEAPPAERALRIAPVRKEPPAAREQGPRDQCTQGGEPGIGLQH